MLNATLAVVACAVSPRGRFVWKIVERACEDDVVLCESLRTYPTAQAARYAGQAVLQMLFDGGRDARAG